MMQIEKIKLLNVWENGLFKELSISEIMKISGKKSKAWVFNSLKELQKNNLIVSKRKGNIDIYTLNLSNNLLSRYLQFLEVKELLDFPKLDIINKIINEIPIIDYCLLVFGSYTERKQDKESDLDICFLIKSKMEEKEIKPYINDIKLKSLTKVDDHYVTFKDFVKMLLRKEENLGKQIFKKHKLFFNPDIYYQLIKEAYKNGFR